MARVLLHGLCRVATAGAEAGPSRVWPGRGAARLDPLPGTQAACELSFSLSSCRPQGPLLKAPATNHVSVICSVNSRGGTWGSEGRAPHGASHGPCAGSVWAGGGPAGPRPPSGLSRWRSPAWQGASEEAGTAAEPVHPGPRGVALCPCPWGWGPPSGPSQLAVLLLPARGRCAGAITLLTEAPSLLRERPAHCPPAAQPVATFVPRNRLIACCGPACLPRARLRVQRT